MQSSTLHHWNAPTLTAPELDVDALGVEDQLVLRNVKARLFDRNVPVSVGRYPIERRIGRGGMGTVYEAVDPELGRRVALKVMLPGDKHAERTKAEARTLAKLSHPNVVTVHEVGQHGERVFLAMEYVAGETLAQWLARGPDRNAILRVFAQAAEGLAAAHERGVIHRDFKPANVLIREDGTVKVIDFGLSHMPVAPAANGGEDVTLDERLTRTGALVGTPAYMSPEQFRGQQLDPRTDVFSFGVVLYEALAGERPYGGHDVASIAAAITGPQRAPRRIKRLPRRLWRNLMRALQTDVEQRPRSLRPLIQAMRVAARSWVPKAGLAAAAFAVASVGAWSLSSPPQDTSPRRDPLQVMAFSAVTSAPSQDDRAEAARAFLAAYEDEATGAERLVTQAAIGLSLRAQSCPTALHGLCVREKGYDDTAGLCPQAPAITWVTVERDPELDAEADAHLKNARHLMSYHGPPDDAVGAAAYYQAVSAVKLATADDELETLLKSEVPKEFDFNGGPGSATTKSAFQAILTHHSDSVERIIRAHATLKGGDRAVIPLAAARTAIARLSFVWLLASVPIPEPMEPELVGPYCESMFEQWRPQLSKVREALSYCRTAANKLGTDTEVCDPVPEGFPRVIP